MTKKQQSIYELYCLAIQNQENELIVGTEGSSDPIYIDKTMIASAIETLKQAYNKKNIACDINQLMTWRDTPEGHDFWSQIHYATAYMYDKWQAGCNNEH
jgi:hypothetical protein